MLGKKQDKLLNILLKSIPNDLRGRILSFIYEESEDGMDLSAMRFIYFYKIFTLGKGDFPPIAWKILREYIDSKRGLDSFFRAVHLVASLHPGLSGQAIEHLRESKSLDCDLNLEEENYTVYEKVRDRDILFLLSPHGFTPELEEAFINIGKLSQKNSSNLSPFTKQMDSDRLPDLYKKLCSDSKGNLIDETILSCEHFEYRLYLLLVKKIFQSSEKVYFKELHDILGDNFLDQKARYLPLIKRAIKLLIRGNKALEYKIDLASFRGAAESQRQLLIQTTPVRPSHLISILSKDGHRAMRDKDKTYDPEIILEINDMLDVLEQFIELSSTHEDFFQKALNNYYQPLNEDSKWRASTIVSTFQRGIDETLASLIYRCPVVKSFTKHIWNQKAPFLEIITSCHIFSPIDVRAEIKRHKMALDYSKAYYEKTNEIIFQGDPLSLLKVLYLYSRFPEENLSKIIFNYLFSLDESPNKLRFKKKVDRLFYFQKRREEFEVILSEMHSNPEHEEHRKALGLKLGSEAGFLGDREVSKGKWHEVIIEELKKEEHLKVYLDEASKMKRMFEFPNLCLLAIASGRLKEIKEFLKLKEMYRPLELFGQIHSDRVSTLVSAHALNDPMDLGFSMAYLINPESIAYLVKRLRLLRRLGSNDLLCQSAKLCSNQAQTKIYQSMASLFYEPDSSTGRKLFFKKCWSFALDPKDYVNKNLRDHDESLYRP